MCAYFPKLRLLWKETDWYDRRLSFSEEITEHFSEFMLDGRLRISVVDHRKKFCNNTVERDIVR